MEAGRLGEGHRTGSVEEAFWERQGLSEELQAWDPGRLKCWEPRGELRAGMPWGRQGKHPGLASE